MKKVQYLISLGFPNYSFQHLVIMFCCNGEAVYHLLVHSLHGCSWKGSYQIFGTWFLCVYNVDYLEGE